MSCYKTRHKFKVIFRLHFKVIVFCFVTTHYKSSQYVHIWSMFSLINRKYHTCFLGKPIYSVDIHPDGSRFVTGGQGNTTNTASLLQPTSSRAGNQMSCIANCSVLFQAKMQGKWLFGTWLLFVQRRTKTTKKSQNFCVKWITI